MGTLGAVAPATGFLCLEMHNLNSLETVCSSDTSGFLNTFGNAQLHTRVVDDPGTGFLEIIGNAQFEQFRDSLQYRRASR